MCGTSRLSNCSTSLWAQKVNFMLINGRDF
jgi:hypothetical protein